MRRRTLRTVLLGSGLHFLAAALLGAPTAKTFTVPGSVLDTVALCSAETCHGLLALVKTDRRALHLLEPRAPEEPRRLSVELPDRVDALAIVDLDEDGRPDVLLGAPGRLYTLGALTPELALETPRTLIVARELDLDPLERGGFFASGRIAVPELGVLRVYGREESGAFAVQKELDLPLRSERESTGLRIFTPPVTRLEVEGRTLYAVGPEARGNRRLRTVLIDAETGVESEAWSWLPSPERLEDSWYAVIGARPVLIVITVSADKVGIFEKKKLRVFVLRTGDRSRSGARPALKADTSSHHWHDSQPSFVDADGDGRNDFVLVQPEGLGGKKLVVEAYLGRTGSLLSSTPLRSAVNAKRADAWHYGADVDGDGVPDLVSRSDHLVQLYRGLIDPKKKQIVEKKPAWQLDLETGFATAVPEGDEAGEDDEVGPPWRGRNYRGRLEVEDLDRDGRAEILLRAEKDGWSVVRWIEH